jgi:PKD repeat protein
MEDLNEGEERKRGNYKPLLIILSILAIVSVILAASSFLPVDDTIVNIKNTEPAKPEIIITSDCKYGKAPLTVNFSCTCNNFTKNITSYRWDFDDGSTSTKKSPQHTFTEYGTYTVELTVTDNLGKSDMDSFIVYIKNRFKLTGGIENDYSETVDVDYIIYSSGDWYDLGGTVFDIRPGEKDSFTLDVKGGFSSYTLIVGWFYPYTDTQVDRVDHDFTNPSGADLFFDIKINNMGEIEVVLK